MKAIFFDLAMKAISQSATKEEMEALNRLLRDNPELREEFEEMELTFKTTKGVVELLETTKATVPEFPEYAQERLRAKVWERFHRKPEERKSGFWRQWGLVWKLAVSFGVVALVALPLMREESGVSIEIAVLDTVGVARSAENMAVELIEKTWEREDVRLFEDRYSFEEWDRGVDRRKGRVVKVVYDLAAAEFRVSGRIDKNVFQRRFEVGASLEETLRDIQNYVDEVTQSGGGSR